ncbi:branched-chain amino acid ABC transporter permease [Bordetella hinzii]|uniref:Branched-chain amino acid ABC transporter permease n=2 Tax=Bordetella hinzii TaxID=103855 RepID=A0AAN1RU53_9BORD|nr:branched-chain amino acid ABC transporter permease [Bordetella hinzii]AKQ54041.1 High-affinity branched-chain amino acid transport system permease protein LivH [Bordetella hinzii]AKQ58532.1 High-affinity branched-chain amino acid transport system permease protein LivH [Bordetella hinzii]AZW16161.1 branched-chain amino acid ABC transporter permease [Bordetella hinzii]KCB21928.1 branched-chain amino acid ABC transporter, permease protein [Bordetella hinzii L60]KCB22409.1 branched-chain amino 
MDILLQLIVNGLLLGGAYAIISIGLTLIFGVVRVVNFAHGEFLMVGMYATYLLALKLGWHPYVSVAPVALLLFAVGAAMQRFIIQPLLDADGHIQIFATVGVSTALMNLALLVFGADVRATPVEAGTGILAFGGLSVVSGQVITLVVALLLAGGLHLFMTRTYLGRAFRAVAQHRNAAALMGVNVRGIYVLAFAIGSAFVGVAAALLTPQYPAFPTIGTYFVLTAFVIVVLGGMGSLLGALLGSMLIGLVDSLAGYYIAPDLKEIVYFAIFLLILVLRPTGLFGLGRGSE